MVCKRYTSLVENCIACIFCMACMACMACMLVSCSKPAWTLQTNPLPRGSHHFLCSLLSVTPPPTHTHSKSFLFFPPGNRTLDKMLDSLSLLGDRGPSLISFCFLRFIGWIQIGIDSPLQKICPQNALVSETKADLLLTWRRKGKPPLTMSNGAPLSSLTVSDIDASPSMLGAGYHWENPSQTREWQGILPEGTLSACLNNNRLSGHKS